MLIVHQITFHCLQHKAACVCAPAPFVQLFACTQRFFWEEVKHYVNVIIASETWAYMYVSRVLVCQGEYNVFTFSSSFHEKQAFHLPTLSCPFLFSTLTASSLNILQVIIKHLSCIATRVINAPWGL